MFRNRKTTRKPSTGLYAAFKQTFPHVGPGTISAVSSAPSSESTTAVTRAPMDHNMHQSEHFGDHEQPKEHEHSLHDTDQWRFTPSMLDTNSFSFASFANHQEGDFSPTAHGMNNAIFQNHPGDIHTPGMAFQLGTPLSSEDSHPTSAIDMRGFHPHLLHSQPFQSESGLQQQQTFAPSSFIHRDSGYDTMEQSIKSADQTTDTKEEAYDASRHGQHFGLAGDGMAAPHMHVEQNFRYQVTLNAPTAMVRYANEIPITYLNKGQAYAISISDTMGHAPSPGPVRYRTVVRISFEDEQQRQRPSACWQLWKEGRGLAEAHQRDGRLQAVEYVDPNQGGGSENRRSRVELDMASFDSFAVTWSSSPASATADCSVAVRFNFLSTDFSHSKGVKGIPVRLCAKTEIISPDTPESSRGPTSEVCFCKVKLFRDHGAERKLSNDIAHIKKTIDKLKQQIAQAETGVKDGSKRKRSGSLSKTSHRPGKVQKHKRTWSVSSQGSSGRPAIEDDLQIKLATMQDMFSSTRPVSVLYLKGYEQDDPDAFPVALPGEPIDLSSLVAADRRSSWESKPSGGSKPSGESTPTNAISPTPTLHSDPRPQAQATFQRPSTFDPRPQGPNDWDHFTHFSTPNFSFDSSVRVPKTNTDDNLPNWIEAFGVDPSYRAPPERPIKPVACLYVLIKVPGDRPENDFYKAVYLMERTVKDLIRSISTKCGVESRNVSRTIRINSKGLKIMVDDDVVRELPEGQDMVVEFTDLDNCATLKEENSDATIPQAIATSAASPKGKSLEMRLQY